MKAIMNAIHS